MPRARALITYPNRQYIALIARVLESGEPFVVPCSRAQAASLRGELYAWRRSAEQDPGESHALSIPLDQLRDIAWRVTDAGLETIPASMLVGPGLIEMALGGAAPKIESPSDRALRELREKLGGS